MGPGLAHCTPCPHLLLLFLLLSHPPTPSTGTQQLPVPPAPTPNRVWPLVCVRAGTQQTGNVTNFFSLLNTPQKNHLWVLAGLNFSGLNHWATGRRDGRDRRVRRGSRVRRQSRIRRESRIRGCSSVRRDSRSWRQQVNLKSVLQIKLSSLPPPHCISNSWQAHRASPVGEKADPAGTRNSRNGREGISFSKIISAPPPCRGLSLPLVRGRGDSRNGAGNGTTCGFL